MRTIGDVMTRDPLTLDCHETLEDAREVMQEHGVHHLVVLDRRRVVGVLSDHDLDHFESRKHVSPAIVSVAQAMTPDPLLARPEEPLADVVQRLGLESAGAVVVLRDAQVVGIFTRSDAVRLLAQELRRHDVIA